MYAPTYLRNLATRSRNAAALWLLAIGAVLTAPAHAQTQVQNTATVTPPAGVTDSNPGNNSSTAIVNVLALPRLTLVKQVINDNGGTAAATDWTLVAVGPSSTISGPTGHMLVTDVSVPVGTYALSEIDLWDGAYAASTYSCVVNGDAPVVSNSVTLAGGDVAICTITNDDQPATLALVKNVSGGPAAATAWTLSAAGPTPLSGAGGVTATPVSAGTYTLSETGGPASDAYTAGNWTCSAGTLSGNQVTLANGQSATCSITNTYVPPAVTYGKSASTAGPVTVGDVITYTLSVTVSNSQTTDVVTLTDTLGTGLTFGSVTSAGAFTCNAANPLVCTLPAGTAPSATPYTLTYTATVNASATGTVNNAVVGTGGDNPGCTTNCDTSTPVTLPAVSYSKAVTLPVGQTEVSRGDTLTYTLTVQVADASTTAAVTLTDTLGTGLTLGTVNAGGFSCGTANPLVCVLPPMTAPGTYVVTYTAIVNELATGFVRNAVVGTGDDNPTCDGVCQTETIVTEPLSPIITYGKTATLPAGRTEVAVGDEITYTLSVTVVSAPTSAELTLTDTLGTGLTLGAINAGSFTCNAANPLVCTLPAGTAPGVHEVTYVATVNAQATGTVNNAVVGTGDDNPTCVGDCDIDTPVVTPVVVVNKSSDPATGATVQPGQTITYTLAVEIGQAAIGAAITLVDTPDRGLTLGAMPAGCTYDGTTMTCTLPAGTPVGLYSFVYTATVNDQANGTVTNLVVASSANPSDPPPTCGTCSTEHEIDQPEVRLSKSAGAREVRIGDLVRYTLTVENVGTTDLVNGSIVDTPPAGFSYVEGSLLAGDADNMATVSGQNPLRFSGVDVPAGQTATLVYVLRVGAGVRPGSHVNQAQVRSATDDPVSNVATAEVVLTADPLLDDSLLFGTVFNDRDGDGWQDSAALSGVKVQGGFAASAYVANSTTVDRGAGPQPEPDASSPLLHGIAVGAISGRQSVADPVEDHQVVIRQRLRELAFTDDFVLTSAQGVTVRMDAAGNTTVEKAGEAAKGLNAAAPTVERRVAQGEGGYVVDYIVRNTGIDERGIPGVRIASVEGLLIETDQYGRYHLAGIPGGAWERGRNFILKVDPSTLPAGAVFTTDNPLLRRITPGVPVRFDFGVTLPEQAIEGGTEQVELELGEVFFAPGSAEVRAQYLPVIEAMAAKVREYQGGEVVINANGDSEGLAFDRANAVKASLLERLDAASAKGLVVSARGNVDDPTSMIVGVDEGGALLGTVLFDTDKSSIRPEFEPLLDKVAAALERMKGGSIAIIGHTDVRASHAYNTALGMRRAKAVYEALAKRLNPEVRAKVRVESSNDPTAPVGVRK